MAQKMDDSGSGNTLSMNIAGGFAEFAKTRER